MTAATGRLAAVSTISTTAITTAITAAIAAVSTTAVVIAHGKHACPPDRVATAINMDHIAFGVDGRATGGTAADIDAAAVIGFAAMLAGFGLRGGAQDERDGGEGGGDGFHGSISRLRNL